MSIPQTNDPDKIIVQPCVSPTGGDMTVKPPAFTPSVSNFDGEGAFDFLADDNSSPLRDGLHTLIVLDFI